MFRYRLLTRDATTPTKLIPAGEFYSFEQVEAKLHELVDVSSPELVADEYFIGLVPREDDDAEEE